MPPKSWRPCQHCGQPFSPASMEMHTKRCTARQDVRAEHDLRELEGFHRPPPLPDWPHCENCGEQYGSWAIGPHTRRCRRLRPHGANGFCAPGAEPFKGLWGIGDIEPLLQKLRKAMGITDETGMDAVHELFKKWDVNGNGTISEKEMSDVLKELCPDFTDEQIDALFKAADTNKDGSVNYEEFFNFLMGSKGKLSQADLDALRAIFNRFDEDKDNLLNTSEFTTLLQNMLPARANDFDVADMDGDGAIDFDEFVKYWTSMVGRPGFEANMFDEAVDMFDCFDKDGSGELERKEFAHLLNNLFPDHCEENEAHVEAEFAACDADSGGGISFPEFLAYYDRLRCFYGERKTGWPPMDAVARKESLGKDFVTSQCGLRFLPDRLPVHRRSCKECKKAAAASAAEAAAAKKRAEEERRRAEEAAEAAAAAKRKAEEDEAADLAAKEQADADAAAARRAAAAEARRKADEEARRRAEAAEAARAAAAEAAANARKRSDGLEECRYCGRTFFPDRLPVHEQCCAKKLGIHGIRPTMCPGETKATIGRYQVPGPQEAPRRPSGSIAGRM